MTHRVADRVQDKTTSTGTGTITLANAPPRTYITVASIPSITIGDTFDYAIFHLALNEFEVGRGTWAGSNQFTRADADVYAGSAGAGTRVTFSAGVKNVIVTMPARAFSGVARTAGSYWRTDSTGKFGEERTAAQVRSDIALPSSITALQYLRGNAGGTAWEARTPRQTFGDITAWMSDGTLSNNFRFWANGASLGPGGGEDAHILRFKDRVFVGAAADYNGDFPCPADSIRWLEQQVSFTQQNGQFVVMNGTGLIGTVSASHTLDWPNAGAMASIGAATYGINDNITEVQYCWAGYDEVVRLAGAGAVLGREIDVTNYGSDVTMTSYNPYITPSSIDLWLASGGAHGGTNPATVALGIVANGDTFNSGIIIGADAITGTDGQTGSGNAIQMAKGHEITWGYAASFGSAATKMAKIRSDVSVVTNAAGLIFHNDGLLVQALGGASTWLTIAGTAATVNGIKIIAGATGVAAAIDAFGGDTNIPLLLRGKGTGGAIAELPAGTQTTPTPAATGGTITSASSSIRTLLMGKWAFVDMSVTIAINGTGSGSVRVALPYAPLTNGIAIGFDQGAAAGALRGILVAGSTNFDILTLANAYPGANGARLDFDFAYQVQ